jgi:hypothetical protein
MRLSRPLLAPLSTAVVFASSLALAQAGAPAPEATAAPAGSAESAPAAEETPAPAATPAAVEAAPPPPPEKPRDRANWHPRYGAEIEAHMTVAAFDQFFVGLGSGVRVNVPIFRPFKGFDNDLGVGFGLDVVRYGAYKPLDPIEPTLRLAAYYVPLYAQWNVWLGSRASLFLEPTLLYRYAEFIDSCTLPQNKTCAPTTRFTPTASVGVRFRIVDKVSGTVRVGWPMATLGASWL